MTYYLIIIHRFVGSVLAKDDLTYKICLYSDLEKAKNKIQEISDSGDFRFSSIDILPILGLDREDKDIQLYYQFID